MNILPALKIVKVFPTVATVALSLSSYFIGGVSVFSNGTATPMIAIMGVTSVAGALTLYLFHPQ
ncbi:MAG TPA: hypothetical protein VF939_00675 [Puia sp.]